MQEHCTKKTEARHVSRYTPQVLVTTAPFFASLFSHYLFPFTVSFPETTGRLRLFTTAG